MPALTVIFHKNLTYKIKYVLGREEKCKNSWLSNAGAATRHDLLNPKGVFGIIVANKWMRSNYGQALRKWLKQFSIIEISDFGDLPVFQGAIAYPCIYISEKNESMPSVNVATIKTLNFQSLTGYIRENQIRIDKSQLSDEGWQLTSEIDNRLLNKIKSKGVPLGIYVNGRIYRGILTGFNEAFVIDENTKNKLIKEDKRSSQLIKPFLAGRDIKRYRFDNTGKYLIFSKRGTDIERYPAIKKHLEQFKKQLTPKPKEFKAKDWPGRKPGSYKWYEIQDAVDYYLEFEKTKIIIPAIVKGASYSWDDKGFYSNDKTSIIPTTEKFLLGVLNSKACDYYMKSIAATKQGGYFEYKPMYVSKLPIPKLSEKQKEEITENVNLILQLNEAGRMGKFQKDLDQIKQRLKHAEEKINQLVYQLYELTPEEIKIVEGATNE